MLGEDSHMQPLVWIINKKLDYLLLFVLFFAALIYIQFSQTIGDPDGFYHAKIALLLSRGELLTSMPWMQLTTLRDSFTDHHLLYHVALVPFVIFGKPLLGVKLATAGFTASFFVVFYWTLKRFHSNAPALFTLVLFLTSAFVFRLSLVKANSLSLIVFFLILIAIFEGRWKLLFVLNMFYVWLYGGWLLAWVVVGIYSVASSLYRLLKKKKKSWQAIFSSRPRSLRKHLSLIILATIGGSLMGLLLNPYWPQNINFYLQQVWQIAIINQGNVIGVGGEWSSYTLREFASNLSFVFIFFGIGIALLLTQFMNMQAQRVRLRTWVGLLLAMVFIVFTLKSRRYIELSAPMMIFFASSVWSDFFPPGMLKHLWNTWKKSVSRIRRELIVSVVIGISLFILVPDVGLWSRVNLAAGEISQGVPLDRYAAASQWLKSNTPAGSVVLHSDWDDWPMLFFYNDHNYYLVGLDPTFMYNYDRELYGRWVDLTRDGTAENLRELVNEDFQSEYIIIEKDHTAMQQQFAQNIYFRLVYEDDDAWIYHALSPRSI